MSEPTDIVERLRDEAKECHRSRHTRWIDPDFLEKAADEIDRLRAVNAELVAALEMAERAYQTGIFNDREDLWGRAIAMRRTALKLAKGDKT